jgi:hypothetical protein
LFVEGRNTPLAFDSFEVFCRDQIEVRVSADFCDNGAIHIDATFCLEMVMGRLLDIIPLRGDMEKASFFVPKSVLFGQLSLLIVVAFLLRSGI